MMFPIKLVFQWCLIFDTKLKLRYLLSDLKIWLEKSGLVRLNEHEHNWSWFLVDPVDDEDVEELRVLRLLVLQLTMRSKEMEEY